MFALLTEYAKNIQNDLMGPTEDRPESGGQRGRGRPTVIDEELVAERAVLLWSEHGYAATGWREIAEATGISVRTLMRRFGSRADIPWVGVGKAVNRLAASLQENRPALPLSVRIRLAVAESISHSEQISRIGPGWLAVVATEPELVAAAPRAYAPWTRVIAEAIARDRPAAAPSVCHALATAYQAAAFDALFAWAAAGAGGQAADAVDAALRWLDIPDLPSTSHPNLTQELP